MALSVARDTLDRATFFLDRAAEVGANDRVAFCHYLESAIVFARSVTFHLQKQYVHSSGFDEWYAVWQDRFKNDPLAKFFTEQRNYSLKVGPLEVRKHVELHMHVTAHASMAASVTVVRGQPWYRRSPRILIDDLSAPLRSWIHVWLPERRRLRSASARQPTEQSAATESLRFVAVPFDDRPALDLLRQHLRGFAELADAAEARFGAGNPEAT